MLAKALQSAALATQPLYIEDVFSTYLYTGNGSTQTITNGIDYTEDFLWWGKSRSNASASHRLVDSVRGVNQLLATNTTGAQLAPGDQLINRTKTSVTVQDFLNSNTESFVGWTFRKAPKFFDVVTYTGTGANRTVAHDLGSVPGCIIVKRTDDTGDWQVYHRANTANPETDYLVLNSTAATADSDTRWNDTLPTATEFSLGTEATVNASGGTYVAYLFAHDAGGFGNDGSENVISCGSYTGNGSLDGPSINLGYETQWVLIKNTSSSADWEMQDVMRGMSYSQSKPLFANLSIAEGTSSSPYVVVPTATGFKINNDSARLNTNGNTYIYLAIRRPNKPPTTGTQVYNAVLRTGTSATASISAGFAVDMAIIRNPPAVLTDSFSVWDRLRGATKWLLTNGTNAELTTADAVTGFDNQTGIVVGADAGSRVNGSAGPYINHFFRRAPGFFDEVCYTGTGSATTVNHNLGVAPEMMIVKKRSATDDWAVYANNDNTDFLQLNTTAATADDNTYWNDTSPTASVFTVGTNADVNTSAATYVAYLFATLPGISKVGSYTGNGTSQTIDCGFTTGARFVLIKRTDNTGDWYVWDSARGIVAGNDPHLSLNTTAAEVTTDDSVDADTSGFIVNQDAATNVNVNTATYIFLAIA